MKILQINSSARVEGSNSTRLANTVTARHQARNPGAHVTVRDLALAPHPVLDAAALGALFTPAEQRTPEQLARVAQDALHQPNQFRRTPPSLWVKVCCEGMR